MPQLTTPRTIAQLANTPWWLCFPRVWSVQISDVPVNMSEAYPISGPLHCYRMLQMALDMPFGYLLASLDTEANALAAAEDDPTRTLPEVNTHHHSSPLIITHYHSSSLIITHHHSSSLIITRGDPDAPEARAS